ncbi:MAG: glutamate synthase subunit alpha, partial [Clostridiales bacterium]|nr:glutamate synthase subunit alpha [Clostridiales bacterium]
ALVGFGASAIHPYLAFSLIEDSVKEGIIRNIPKDKAINNYMKAVVNGIVKIMSKMGISTIAGYQGAQVFEALGISQRVIDKYFTGTVSRIEGLEISHIAQEIAKRHNTAYDSKRKDPLASGGQFQYTTDGEYHMYNPETIHIFQQAVRKGDYELYKQYYSKLELENEQKSTLRALLDFKTNKNNEVPLSEVEPVERIVTRFKTGAMSYGSIGEEAHKCMAIAMNRLKGKSNSGEGGEDPDRLNEDENGDIASSAIKQVASGRFGVTAQYLASAKEIQIKMAQGAKPGEGGHLPGHKVYPWIAKVRNSTPGVGLISPPPHHDIYSIEDLAQLIYDLKNANSSARINVKLVSEAGVGTIAAGVAKSRADVILISGHDGGTGASPRTSIQHAGLPWELGVAETHHTLEMNGLRDRVLLETDGKMMSGRDVAIAALLGAEEYGFATLPLVSLGCIMMRVCNLNTCPVGVATQNPELRKFFSGKPEYVENCLIFIAQHLREIMAELGFRSLDEMIGRSDLLVQKEDLKGNAASVNLSSMLEFSKNIGPKHMAPRTGATEWEHYFASVKALVDTGEKVVVKMNTQNTDRTTGTRMGTWIAKRYGNYGIEKDTITYKLKGTAGQSLGAFIPQAITMELMGDANDYVAKGMCGGKVIIYPPNDATYEAHENTIIGNVACYGATDGELYVRGLAGERFCVRNSGVTAVVEGIGDHGCEYMTGGTVAILGPVGYNFAAGMSGGVAYVYDKVGDFSKHCNMEMITLEKVEDKSEQIKLHQMIKKHKLYTGSSVADKIIGDWDNSIKKFVKVLPID